jgi:hypothetical protein
MDKRRIKKAFADTGIGKTIARPQPSAVAAELNIPKIDIATYSNPNWIKIRGCQPGCFK